MSENTSSEFKKLQKKKDAFFSPWIDMVEAPKKVNAHEYPNILILSPVSFWELNQFQIQKKNNEYNTISS